MGNNDADSCVPAQVTDFIFDLSDSVTLSQIAEEQAKLYTTTFRELCTKVRAIDIITVFRSTVLFYSSTH